MSKKRVEQYIPTTVNILKEEFSNGKIPSVYNGYISAFGASILQSGLKATLALYENQNNRENTQADKSVVTKLILKALDSNANGNSLLQYVLNSNQNETLLKEKIIDIAVALKLSLRTFNLTKD